MLGLFVIIIQTVQTRPFPRCIAGIPNPREEPQMEHLAQFLAQDHQSLDHKPIRKLYKYISS